MMDYNVLPPNPGSGYQYAKAEAERRAELARSRGSRATDGPVGAVLALLGGLVRFIFFGLIRPWQKRR